MKDPAIRSNRMQCLCALVSASIVVLGVCIGVTMNLTTLYDENFDHMGLQTFCMFTVNSNILTALAMMLCIPYTVDGLRTGYYHLPDWVVILMHMAVTAISLNFLISLCILAPVKGFALIYGGSRFFLHGVCPVLAILTFCFFICSHLIRLKESFLALIPVFIYAVLYFIMVVVIGEEHGGWNDFYGFATRLPVWIPAIVIMPLTFGLATLLRLAHNKTCLNRRAKDAELYREAYSGKDLREVIAEMARSRRTEMKTKSIVVPSQVIGYMIENTGSDLDPQEACRIYFETFVKDA
ncbi:MAG: hypothetical protein IJK77_09485 [Lachnospiraceae bacterium]|nr:hypothetical protein [Lachnospiraceae bacterium]